jgi:hypothetical protein
MTEPTTGRDGKAPDLMAALRRSLERCPAPPAVADNADEECDDCGVPLAQPDELESGLCLQCLNGPALPCPAASPAAVDTGQGEDGALYRLGLLGYAIAQILEIDPTDDRITRLLAGPIAPLLAAQEAVQRVRAVIGEEENYRAESPAWEITVVVPVEAGDELADSILDAVADAAYEAQPEDRDGWDIFVGGSKNPTAVPTHLLRRALGDPS